MLVVKIELWPNGHAAGSRELCRGFIVNDGTGTGDIGNYYIRLKMPDNTRNIGRVIQFPRNLSPWTLLYRALKDIAREEKIE